MCTGVQRHWCVGAEVYQYVGVCLAVALQTPCSPAGVPWALLSSPGCSHPPQLWVYPLHCTQMGAEQPQMSSLCEMTNAHGHPEHTREQLSISEQCEARRGKSVSVGSKAGETGESGGHGGGRGCVEGKTQNRGSTHRAALPTAPALLGTAQTSAPNLPAVPAGICLLSPSSVPCSLLQVCFPAPAWSGSVLVGPWGWPCSIMAQWAIAHRCHSFPLWGRTQCGLGRAASEGFHTETPNICNQRWFY